MIKLNYKTRCNTSPQGKPRVYFCCHPEDFERYFEMVSDEILAKQDCAIWFCDNLFVRDDDFFMDLKQMQLFVMPVTTNLLTTENETLNIEFKFAVENHIPVLPLMQESGLDNLFNKKCGDLQFLDKYSNDSTAISYDDKLQKYLESVLIGNELAEKIRAAFDAYVFLSYRKKDRRYAQELMRLIHKNDFCRDIAIWYDEFLTPGENFNDSIKEALQKSGLFVLTVTPNLVNEPNYIMTTEYPMARQEGKPILPAELVPTDRDKLSEKYVDIPNPTNAYNDVELSEALLESIKRMNIKENDISPEHNFFIGLAYLGGVDVEVDRERALELITMSAEEDLPEAMLKLIAMYTDGIGVERDSNAVQKWSKRLADYYFKKIISRNGTLKSKNKVHELFLHYEDKYWAETIKFFLVYADERLEVEVLNELYLVLMQQGYCEYTLFFEACKEMVRHKDIAQKAFLRDILHKSVNGTYPPYGPLFWYVPKYELYEQLLLILGDIKGKSHFTKSLALSRDVCWIFGRYNTVYEITNCVDGDELFALAELYGVRRSLCELFFTGTVTEECGDDIYPRCFNIDEAKSWKEHGCGLLGRMSKAFDDELRLYSHESLSELNGEYIGIVSAPYIQEQLDTVLSHKSCKKLCGLFLSPTEQTEVVRLAINDSHLNRIYAPENAVKIAKSYMQSAKGPFMIKGLLIYYHDTICLPSGIKEFEPFAWCHTLKTVVIPDGVEAIGMCAFQYCNRLASITIPNSVTEIGAWAFDSCNLKSIRIPNSVKKIDFWAFKNCRSLETVMLSESLIDMDTGVFEGCSSLKRIYNCPPGYTAKDLGVPDDCLIIERSQREDERKFIVPLGATIVKDGDVPNRRILKNIYLPEGLKEIGSRAFQDCNELVFIDIPDSVEKIGEHAFYKCYNLISVIIPDGVKKIENSTFYNCRAMTTIIIPDSVAEIGKEAFVNCYSLTSIVLPNGLKQIQESTFTSCYALEAIVVPKGVTEIGNYAFELCKSLKAITLHKGVTQIGDYAFDRCRSLKTITLHEGVTKIGRSAFRECTALTSISLPKTLKEVGQEAFKDCNLLEIIELPDDVRVIGEDAFKGCDSLKRIYNCPVGYTAEELGVSDQCEIVYRSVRKAEIELVIPQGVTVISQDDVINRRVLKTVNTANSVTSIDVATFTGCCALESINLPNTIVTIGQEAFLGCINLKAITIPSAVSRIERYTFGECRSLKAIHIPDNVTVIGPGAFCGCSDLRTIDITDTVEEIGYAAFKNCNALEAICIPGKLEVVEKSTFEKCHALRMVVLPESVNKIGDYAFADCYNLEKINIPNGITEIGIAAFRNCSELKAIVIPANVKSISLYAFEGCCKLKEITLSRRFEEKLKDILKGIDFSQITVNWI